MRLKLLANKSYASVILIVFTIGAGLYGISFLLPQFLSGISGYNAEQSGGIMLVSGLPAFLMMPLLPRMLGKFDARAMVIAGSAVLRRQLHARHQPHRRQRRA